MWSYYGVYPTQIQNRILFHLIRQGHVSRLQAVMGHIYEVNEGKDFSDRKLSIKAWWDCPLGLLKLAFLNKLNNHCNSVTLRAKATLLINYQSEALAVTVFKMVPTIASSLLSKTLGVKRTYKIDYEGNWLNFIKSQFWMSCFYFLKTFGLGVYGQNWMSPCSGSVCEKNL